MSRNQLDGQKLALDPPCSPASHYELLVRRGCGAYGLLVVLRARCVLRLCSLCTEATTRTGKDGVAPWIR